MLMQAASRFSQGGVKTDVAERLSKGTSRGVAQHYDFTVVEDEPWNIRSRAFPQFEGEFWAPLDKFSDSGKGMGLLFKPKRCKQLRFMHTKTGLFCDVLAADKERGSWFVARKGGAHSCPPRPGCNTQRCVRIHAADVLSTRKCAVLGEAISCPNNTRVTLASDVFSRLNSPHT